MGFFDVLVKGNKGILLEEPWVCNLLKIDGLCPYMVKSVAGDECKPQAVPCKEVESVFI